MENIFDKIKVYASNAKTETGKIAKHVWGKTNDLVGQTKISVAIAEVEGKINDIYKEIGSIVYSSYSDGEEFGEKINSCCEKIASLQEELEDLRKELAKFKPGVQCACGQYNTKEATYCSKCGEKLTQEKPFEDEQVVIIKPVSEE